MKRILTIFIFILILCISKTSYAGILSISAKGVVRFSPKNARLIVQVSSHAKTQKQALKKLQDKINIIAKNIKHNIKTTYININPSNVYNFKSHKMVNNGYNGQEVIRIKFKVNKLNKSILGLLNIKNVQIQNIKYYDNSLLKYKIKAIKIAFKKALDKAKSVLNTINKKIKDIKSIKITGNYTPVYRPLPIMIRSVAIRKTTTSKTIFSGKNKIIENIYIEIEY